MYVDIKTNKIEKKNIFNERSNLTINWHKVETYGIHFATLYFHELNGIEFNFRVYTFRFWFDIIWKKEERKSDSWIYDALPLWRNVV